MTHLRMPVCPLQYHFSYCALLHSTALHCTVVHLSIPYRIIMYLNLYVHYFYFRPPQNSVTDNVTYDVLHGVTCGEAFFSAVLSAIKLEMYSLSSARTHSVLFNRIDLNHE